MKIYIGSDHAGFELKKHLVEYLESNGLGVTDTGPFAYDKTDDYPDWISKTAEAVAGDIGSLGIVIGLSGQGEAIVANKFKGIRAGVFYGSLNGSDTENAGKNNKGEEIIKLLREHNNANILSLGAKFVTPKEAERAVDIFIETQFNGEERHERRIKKIDML